MFQYDEKGVENMLLRIAVCDDEAIHRLIIRDKLDAYAISNDIDYELDEFTNSKELMKMENMKIMYSPLTNSVGGTSKELI